MLFVQTNVLKRDPTKFTFLFDSATTKKEKQQVYLELYTPNEYVSLIYSLLKNIRYDK